VSFEQAASLAQLLLVPVVGLLWRISTKLELVGQKLETHAGRLEALDGRKA